MRFENITVLCFFASYLVAMGLEATRLLKSVALNQWAAWFAGLAGFGAQTAYLVVRSHHAELPPLLASTHDWVLVLAWLTVLIYLVMAGVHRKVASGLFLLPLVVILVAASRFVSREPNPDLNALRWWGMAHASFLALGIAGVVLAGVSSLMFLVQHGRLKHRQAAASGLQLFSLERLGRLNWWCIVVAVPLLTLGMASGILLTILPQRTLQPISLWQWPFVVNGLAWLALMALFGWLLTARRATGRLVAVRTLLACGFVLVTLMLLSILGGGMHGAAKAPTAHHLRNGWPAPLVVRDPGAGARP